jgi:TAP-like protein
MSTRHLARLGAGSGIAYVGLIMVAGQFGPGGGVPGLNASPEAIGAYITSHPPIIRQWAALYVEVLALLALVLFVTYLGRILRDAERDGGWLAGAALASGPAAAYSNAIRVDRQLPNSLLLTLNGWCHVALGRSACIQQHVADYLITVQPPRPGTTCQPDRRPFQPLDPSERR